MKKLFFPIFYLFTTLASAQTIDHWETVVTGTGTWKYLIPVSQPNTSWTSLNYNDTSWNTGNGSIGFGDGDDNTVISNAMSVYMRKQFTVIDTSKIEYAVLHADYDDGFVAYLNGVEIARANMGTPGTIPAFNQPADASYEAQLYQGGIPSYFLLDKSQLNALMLPGNNVISVEVHNILFSPDLTSLFYLSVSINDSSFSYDPLPSWFYPPLISSDLPIISINTSGQEIPDDPRIVVDMGIINNGAGVRNFISDPFNNYNGKVNIEVRGSSSQMFPKKSFSFETQDITNNSINVSLLGLPSENDWVLYAPYNDKTLMRDVLMYKMGREMGYYASRFVFTELILNGQYQGIYILEEKIKRDGNRVNIDKLNPQDTIGDELTGGYILKIDKPTGSSASWQSAYPPYLGAWQSIEFFYHDPDSEDLMPQQRVYIRNYMYETETALIGSNFLDPNWGYRKYFNTASIIDFFIANEISRNVDGYRLSTYFYKDKDSNNGKIILGPLWDFNITLGNSNYCDGGLSTGWAYQFNNVCGTDPHLVPFWWNRFMQDTNFVNDLQCRWQDLRQNSLNTNYLLNTIDSLALIVDESQQRNFKRWPILGTYIWPNNIIFNTYVDEVNYLKSWLTDRLNWLDLNMPGNCIPLSLTSHESPDFSNIQVYPNPVKKGSDVYLNFTKSEETAITISDISGKLLESFAFRNYEKGKNKLSFKNNSISNGIYIIKFNAKNFTVIKKLVVY